MGTLDDVSYHLVHIHIKSALYGACRNERHHAITMPLFIMRHHADNISQWEARSDAMCQWAISLVERTVPCMSYTPPAYPHGPTPPLPLVERTVPDIILDRVVAVQVEGDAGTVMSSGPADATAAGEAERLDADVEVSRQARYISAFEPQVGDLNEADSSGTLEVTALLHQLQQLEQAAQRSVAAETETALESGASLPDEAGRERILAL